ncbi:hypothetical protein [Croceimicrobium hydrocarbonivorans]|uniref:YdhG-like domain-containing protein n=1 Tax=Croceimicrobium hydrocarbonivorans TaxID=2761580 RepID=A0A7H0VAM8_9FLAO|nr:hypothetical protein [Croceimicrobium hydrocarbonivorans]QNR22776.1 hypothetical protein H4K34_10330 [Croceimicrobium hydrocarbonivorans]
MSELSDLAEIQSFLAQSLKEQCPPLRVRKEGPGGLEVCGRKETMQGKQKVDGYYFASTAAKPKDIRFYFFPIYTDPELFQLSEGLQKMLKGKSCFHVKKLSEEQQAEIRKIIALGVNRYNEKELI